MAVHLIAMLTITQAVVGVLLWREERWLLADLRWQAPRPLARALTPVALPPTTPPAGREGSNYVSPLF